MTAKNICYNRVMRTLVLILLVGFFCLGNTASAQFDSSFIGDAVNITLSPQFPGPGDLVTVELDDYSIDSSGATISWILDGNEIPAYKNLRTISVISPTVGKTVTIEVRLIFSNKPTISAKTSIKPLYVDVIVEPQTYTSVFYQGRALPVHGSVINLTTLIQGSTGMFNPQEYTYNWQLNGKSIYGGPRAGNNRAQIVVPFGRNSLIGLTITSKSGEVVGRKVVSIPIQDVEVIFYENSTLYGLSERAIGESLTLVGNSSTIRAVPYYLDAQSISRSLFSEWKINNQVTNTETRDPFEINIQRQGDGEARVSFKIRNLSELLQGDEESFRVQF